MMNEISWIADLPEWSGNAHCTHTQHNSTRDEKDPMNLWTVTVPPLLGKPPGVPRLPYLLIVIINKGVIQKRLLFAGFTAVKKTIIQNWFTPHMCREAYWIRSLLQIVSCECTTARVGGARPSTIEAWQSFLLTIRNYLKEWLLCSCCPSLSPSLLIEPWDVKYVSAVLFCFILDILFCCVWKK